MTSQRNSEFINLKKKQFHDPWANIGISQNFKEFPIKSWNIETRELVIKEKIHKTFLKFLWEHVKKILHS